VTCLTIDSDVLKQLKVFAVLDSWIYSRTWRSSRPASREGEPNADVLKQESDAVKMRISALKI